MGGMSNVLVLGTSKANLLDFGSVSPERAIPARFFSKAAQFDKGGPMLRGVHTKCLKMRAFFA